MATVNNTIPTSFTKWNTTAIREGTRKSKKSWKRKFLLGNTIKIAEDEARVWNRNNTDVCVSFHSFVSILMYLFSVLSIYLFCSCVCVCFFSFFSLFFCIYFVLVFVLLRVCCGSKGNMFRCCWAKCGDLCIFVSVRNVDLFTDLETVAGKESSINKRTGKM